MAAGVEAFVAPEAPPLHRDADEASLTQSIRVGLNDAGEAVVVDEVVAEAPAAEPAKKLAGKYEKTEDLEAAYLALQAKLGAAKPADKAPAPDGKPTLKDLVALETVTDEQLTAAGLDRDTLDTYKAGQAAKAAASIAPLVKIAGSEQDLADAVEWGRSNMSASEKAAYDKGMNSGDTDLQQMVVERLVGKFRTAVPKEPALITGGEGVPADGAIQGFKSNREVAAAINNPKYKTDASYRNLVAQRLAKTSMAGM